MNITYWIIVTLLFSSCSKTHLRNCKNDYQKSKEKWINNIPNYSQEFKNDIIDKINVSDTVVFARKGTGYHFLLWKENGRQLSKDYIETYDNIKKKTIRCDSCSPKLNTLKLDSLYTLIDTQMYDIIRRKTVVNDWTGGCNTIYHVSFHFMNNLFTNDFTYYDLEEITCPKLPNTRFREIIFELLNSE